MFSLIISIISILLVAALALATIYYGGNAFNKGTDEAVASQLINEGQQLQGARTLKNQAAAIKSGDLVPTLAPDYLAQVPAGWDQATDISVANSAFTKTIDSVPVCAAVNFKAGQKTADGKGKTDLTAVPSGAQFACVTTGSGATATYAVHYRF